MKNRIVILLVVFAVGLLVFGLMLDRSVNRLSTPDAPGEMPSRLFEGLTAKINDVASVTITRTTGQFTISRVDGGKGEWGIVEKGGYPAQFEPVKGLIMGLAELKPLEAKTANSELYAKIGVQDVSLVPPPLPPAVDAPAPEAPTGGPALVTLKDKTGAVLASAILGNTRPGQRPAVFVRKAGAKESWLAEVGGPGGGGRLEAPANPMACVERQIANIGRDRIKAVSAKHADGETLSISRAAAADRLFVVAGVPEGREITAPSMPDGLANAMGFVSIEDVIPLSTANLADITPRTVTDFRTFDGLVVTACLIPRDAKVWVTFAVTVDEDAIKAIATATGSPESPTPDAAAVEKAAQAVRTEADALRRKIEGWAFALPEHKINVMGSRLEAWLKPPAPPPSVNPVPTPILPDNPGG